MVDIVSTLLLIPPFTHIEQYKTIYRQYPQSITAGTGYVSEETFNLQNGTVEDYVKHSSLDKQQSANHYKKILLPQSNITMNKEIGTTG